MEGGLFCRRKGPLLDFSVTSILLDLAVILLATKFCGLVTRHIGLPQVVGMILAGLLIGPAIVSQFDWPFSGIINPSEAEMNVLQAFSQVGACLILFSSGLETKFSELKKSGLAATLIAVFGVAVPMLLGVVVSALFMGGFSSMKNPELLQNALFVGCILTATSVGITIETLRELGKLSSPIGTVILSAAIIDDVIGIVVLSIVTSFQGGGSIWMTILKVIGFFIFCAVLGYLCRVLFRWLSANRPHKRRTSILAFALCFLFAYYAEEYFGVASITGAFMAGIMISGLKDTNFVDRKALVAGYMIFTPIFFAYIGISADFSQFKWSLLLFSVIFVVVGILGKVLGCSGVAKSLKFSGSESLSIGFGMIARGEVALAVYASGKTLIAYDTTGTVIGIDPLIPTIFLILCSSVLCPIFLKLSFKQKKAAPPVKEKPAHPDDDLSWLYG